MKRATQNFSGFLVIAMCAAIRLRDDFIHDLQSHQIVRSELEGLGSFSGMAQRSIAYTKAMIAGPVLPFRPLEQIKFGSRLGIELAERRISGSDACRNIGLLNAGGQPARSRRNGPAK